MVYSESAVKVDESSKNTKTMKGIILVNAANQNTASVCTLEKIIRHSAPAGSAVITKDSQSVP